MCSAAWVSPQWVSRIPLHVWPEPNGVGLVSPEVCSIIRMSFRCAPAHSASAHKSRTTVSRSSAFSPMSCTHAGAHLAFPRSWTAVPRCLDFAMVRICQTARNLPSGVFLCLGPQHTLSPHEQTRTSQPMDGQVGAGKTSPLLN